jgi:bifunctional DNase/RNase
MQSKSVARKQGGRRACHANVNGRGPETVLELMAGLASHLRNRLGTGLFLGAAGMRMVSVPRKETVMRTVTDTGLVEMRFGKVVGVATAEGDACCCVVLEAVSGDCQLPIHIGDTEAFNLAATLTGEEFARPMSPQFAAGLLSALGGQVRQVRIDRLIPAFGGGIAYAATVEVDGASGVELVDSRPSDALNLVALVPAPIFAAQEVLADAEARLEGDSPEAILLRRALESEQMTVRRVPPDPLRDHRAREL